MIIKLLLNLYFNDVTRSKIIEEARAQIKYKTLFLAKVAHEFKNPLIMIKELVDQVMEGLEILTNNNPDERIIENLLLSKNLSSYMLILVKDFEVISKKENSTKIEISKTPFDVREEMFYLQQIVQTLISKKYGTPGDSPLKFSIVVDEDVPSEVITDKMRLCQILINLLSNAIKFTHLGYIELRLSMTEDGLLKFSVSDTGSGIPGDQVPFLFKDFRKGEDMNNPYGSGLGLSIVRELCSLLRSEIKFEPNYSKRICILLHC